MAARSAALGRGTEAVPAGAESPRAPRRGLHLHHRLDDRHRADDGGLGAGLTGDLRYCVDQADANNQENTIGFDSTVFGTHRTITLGGSQLELNDTGGWNGPRIGGAASSSAPPCTAKAAASTRGWPPADDSIEMVIDATPVRHLSLGATPGTWRTRA